jgi:NAD(P)H-flavin reductase
VILGIGVARRAAALLRHPQDAEGAPARTSLLGRAHTLWAAHVGVPALVHAHQAAGGWGFLSLPTRLEALLIFIYVALNFIWSCTNYELFDDNLFWPGDRRTQLARYIADRTGIMSFYNLPLLWVLAGRNDVLLWLTGWSYASASLFHRWVARVATLQAIVHSAAYTWLEKDELAASFKERYWATGVFATVTMALLLPLSIRPLREKAYEAFLLLHIALALPTLVLLFYHVDIFGTDYNGYLWACVALWAFDRALRLARIALLSRRSNAVIQDGPLVRLTVAAPAALKPHPGAYYFLYRPRSLAPWQNHPFTLAAWKPTPKGVELTFLFRKRGRSTRALALGAPTLLLEGPYGARHHLAGFDRVLLVAGGSGVSAILPYAGELERATVVWAVRTHDFAADVLAHELVGRAADVYISGESGWASNAVPKEGDSKEKDADAASGSSEAHAFHAGRPDVGAVLAAEVAALVGAQRLAVLGCGPPGMMDDLRAAVARSYGTGEGQVAAASLAYFEDAFQW